MERVSHFPSVFRTEWAHNALYILTSESFSPPAAVEELPVMLAGETGGKRLGDVIK